MVWFPAFLLKNLKELIDLRNDDRDTIRLRQETFCNNGRNEA